VTAPTPIERIVAEACGRIEAVRGRTLQAQELDALRPILRTAIRQALEVAADELSRRSAVHMERAHLAAGEIASDIHIARSNEAYLAAQRVRALLPPDGAGEEDARG
jgi:hypothetical protein